MKKTLIASLALTLALTACNKQETPPADKPAETATTAAPQPSAHEHHEHTDAEHNHEHHDHEDGEHHEHDGHDHNHEGHNHSHAPEDAVAYQCGDKTVHIAVHDHEGEIEAHLTQDDITYDLEQDVQTKGRFTSDDSIAGDDKGMVLVIDGSTAKVTTLDNKTLLDCTKK